ncbi:hypothetical protein GTGU_04708 [Trabulsiella guamensis ATCC 49490]|uniref:Eaa family phage protein n=1 Tax=Trabulsiella guamensis ATCC 49490 TaxID=1005994 RepID=A0A084ZCC2_9ENTR|nr:hypothetical protein [Trabulsiella guamensis]KFB95116.1 hypothetical protein GTGU_04708 [Trabulsiella guamensis ATCC 49490]
MSNITREEIEHYLRAAKMIQTCDFDKGKHITVTPEHMIEIARIALASLEAEPVGEFYEAEPGNWYQRSEGDKAPKWTKLYAAPPVPSVPDYFAALVEAARVRADKAMRKHPQPNYVLNKVAEESGEVIKAVIHFTEGREEWRKVEYELIDNLAMLLRLVVEGDQVIGFTPPCICLTSILSAPLAEGE